MSPLLAILRLCTDQYQNLTEDQIRELLRIAIETDKRTVAVPSIRKVRRK